MPKSKYFETAFYKELLLYWRWRLVNWAATQLQTVRANVLRLSIRKEPFKVNIGNPARIVIILVGTGGTGSYVVRYLAQLTYTLLSVGQDMRLVLVDPDQVEPKNVARQDFCRAEVGRNKAETLAQRYREAYGIPITAVADKFRAEMLEQFRPASSQAGTLTLVVGAVDSWEARRDIAEAIEPELRRRGSGTPDKIWWIDSGNETDYGQVLSGNSLSSTPLLSPLGFCFGVPLPHLQDGTLVARRERPAEGSALSCADLTWMGEQDALINKMMATWVAHHVFHLIVRQDLTVMATYVNLGTGRVSSSLIEGGQYVRLHASSSRPAQPPITPITQPPVAEPAAEIDPNAVQCPDCEEIMTRGVTTRHGVELAVLFCRCGHHEEGCPRCMGQVRRVDNGPVPRMVCDECRWQAEIPEAYRNLDAVELTEVAIDYEEDEAED